MSSRTNRLFRRTESVHTSCCVQSVVHGVHASSFMFAGFHPILFSAVLDTPAITQYRFLLVLECEHLLPYSLSISTNTPEKIRSNSSRTTNISNSLTNIAPRFSVGSVNATRLICFVNLRLVLFPNQMSSCFQGSQNSSKWNLFNDIENGRKKWK